MKTLLIFILSSLLLFQINIIAQYNWEFVSPNIPSSTWNDVKVVNDSTIIVAGSSGLIVRTSDFGINWDIKLNVVGSESNINKLFFLDEKNGFAVGNSGFLINTTDGGINWRKNHIPDNFSENFRDIFFVNKNIGFIVGDSETILKSEDGGFSWQPLIGNDGDNFSVYFFNEKKGWICGNSLLWTTDGGNSWYEYSLPYTHLHLKKIQFANNQVGFIVGYTLGYYGDRPTALIIKTEDGGNTWNTIFSVGWPCYGRSLDIINKDTAFFLGDFPGQLMYTYDGGANWQSSSDLASLFAFDFYQSIGIGVAQGIMYYTTDIGKNWKKLIDDIFISLRTFDFDKSGFGILGGSNGILRTTNKGKDWEKVYNDPEFNIYGVEIIDSSNIFVSGHVSNNRGIILYSSDGGINWSTNINTAQPFSDIKFNDKLNGWAGTSGSLIYVTTNGGLNWSVYNSKVSTIKDIYFINNDIGWACGGGISHTTDGGETWTKQSTKWNHSIYFINQSEGWAVGADILHSTDAGNTWELQYAGEHGASFRSVYFFNKFDGIVAGAEGQIYTTSDGGITWQVEKKFCSEDLLKLKFAGNEGWLLTNGSVYHTNIDGINGINDDVTSPANWKLYQNYPNPFNPTTKIKYTIPNSEANLNSKTKLKVYNVLGKEIATLVNEEKSAGSYEIEFDASNLPSGVYFYQIRSGSYSQTKKMVLLR